MNLPSSLWRDRTRTARLLTCAAVTSLLMTGCASGESSTSRQAEEVPAALVGSEQPSASPAIPLVGSDEDASTDSDETTDENSQANQASPEATPSDIDSESTEPTDNRVTSWLANKMRICVQNTSSAPIVLEWNSYMQNGKSEYLKPYELKKTLGPSAFDCAVTYAMFGSEVAYVELEGQEINIENGGGPDFDVRFGESTPMDLAASEPVVSTWSSGITEGRLIEARVTTTDELVQYEQIQVYPIDIRVFDAN